MPVYKYPSIVENDLKNDFGQYWNCLSDFTKNVFITGITSLIAFVSCEKNNRQTSLDYSSVIISISRGLERELKDIFYCKFQEYLIRKNVDPSNYKRLTNFTFMDGDNLTYTKSDFWFTLGKMKIIVNEHLSTSRNGDKYTNIDYYLRDFCDVIFKKNAFSSDSFNRKIDITKYMCELAKQVDDIANNFRNEAAHTNSISSLGKARVCVDWIIKVKKLLLKLIEKIDYSVLYSV